MNDFVAAYNRGGDTAAAEGPAIDALNHSADAVEADINGPLSQQLRDALNAYDDAARDVANAIRAHAAIDEFNQRVNQLNDTKTKPSSFAGRRSMSRHGCATLRGYATINCHRTAR